MFNNTHIGRPTTYTVSVATGETFDLAAISLRTSHGHHAVPTISISGKSADQRARLQRPSRDPHHY